MKLYVTWSFLLLYYLVPCRPKYDFQNCILEINICVILCVSLPYVSLSLSPFFSLHLMSCLVMIDHICI